MSRLYQKLRKLWLFLWDEISTSSNLKIAKSQTVFEITNQIFFSGDVTICQHPLPHCHSLSTIRQTRLPWPGDVIFEWPLIWFGLTLWLLFSYRVYNFVYSFLRFSRLGTTDIKTTENLGFIVFFLCFGLNLVNSWHPELWCQPSSFSTKILSIVSERT